MVRTPWGAWCFGSFLRVSWWLLNDFDFAASSSGVAGVAFGACTCRSACRHASGLRVSWWFQKDFALLGEWHGGLKYLLMSPFLESCVSWSFRTHFWLFFVLNWFRTDLSDADVMRRQDLGAGMAFSWSFRSKVALLARPREGLKKSICDRDASIAAT